MSLVLVQLIRELKIQQKLRQHCVVFVYLFVLGFVRKTLVFLDVVKRERRCWHWLLYIDLVHGDHLAEFQQHASGR